MVITEKLSEFHSDWVDELVEIPNEPFSYYSSGRVLDGPLSPVRDKTLSVEKILAFFAD